MGRRTSSPLAGGLAPTAITAEDLGYSPATIEIHARGSAGNYAIYMKARLDAGAY